MQNHWLFSSNNIYFCKCQKAEEKKSKEDKQTLEELIRLITVRKQSVSYFKPVTLNELNSCFCHIINIYNQAKSVCMGESWPQSCVQTLVKILPYRPPARFIRATCKYGHLFPVARHFTSDTEIKTEFLLQHLYFSSDQNWTFCNSWYHSKFTWASKDSFWQDHAPSFAAGCKEWQEHWWCDNHGRLFCCWQLVWKQTSCGFYTWVT